MGLGSVDSATFSQVLCWHHCLAHPQAPLSPDNETTDLTLSQAKSDLSKEQHSQFGCQSITCVTTMDPEKLLVPSFKRLRVAPMTAKRKRKMMKATQETEVPTWDQLKKLTTESQQKRKKTWLQAGGANLPSKGRLHGGWVPSRSYGHRQRNLAILKGKVDFVRGLKINNCGVSGASAISVWQWWQWEWGCWHTGDQGPRQEGPGRGMEDGPRPDLVLTTASWPTVLSRCTALTHFEGLWH
ncbi:hypothetical protein QTO34_000785 [Cnephaeus nilssonii]|uniref:Uncharacterized protein n=1 Tax=Cnephaeus nilssonii TaxID=3371016 RepID=A0AA40ID41_CNENI|nr:hypothetical protein QTO34_000785 [Eptesicus nilssonii]